MKRGWTADIHFGHSNIINYCARPFKDCHHMNTSILNSTNSRLTAEDMVCHVGDFCVRGGQKSRDWVPRLLGHWSFIRGNHDKNNGVKTLCDWMFTRIGIYSVFVSHVPYYYKQQVKTANYLLPNELVEVIEATCDFALCGHVHEKWSVSHEGAIPCFNVGVDVRKFAPIFDDELIGLYEKGTRK